ncbi:hypothetical protein HS088_TW07G00171 [Tripterygium wilfordii]|uniref:Uncharacterized protein n=1 Tax=Tripterygium wilfordii TaxID=458696 RepID=A0A7J7DEU9_TRIWF|nr:hypothetical protein HS088_TW07G00171 [Tripterygium wilfordii]
MNKVYSFQLYTRCLLFVDPALVDFYQVLVSLWFCNGATGGSHKHTHKIKAHRIQMHNKQSTIFSQKQEALQVQGPKHTEIAERPACLAYLPHLQIKSNVR